jgi:hypothetical protein
MAIDWDADVLGPVMAVFGEGDPALSATLPIYMPQAGPSFTLADAVFDREYLDVNQFGDGGDNTSRKPILGVRLALLPTPPLQGDRVYIPSVNLTYIVREVRPDGHGHAVLSLNATAP